jgi:hypothetical protein
VLGASALADQAGSPCAKGQLKALEGSFREVRRQGATGASGRAAVQTEPSPALSTTPNEVVTRNLFVPFRAAGKDAGSSSAGAVSSGGGSCRSGWAAPSSPDDCH